MKMSELYPESLHGLVHKSREELVRACREGITVTGRVEKILKKSEELLICFGGTVGYLPFEEVSIYPYQYSKKPDRKLPINICVLLGKNICVKVTEVTEERITLSRKKNMEEAYEYLKTCSSSMFYVTNLTQHTAFGDIGYGITAKLNVREACKARIRNIGEVIRPKDFIRVALMNATETQLFEVSSRQLYKEYNMNDYFEGMVIKGTVNEPVDDTYSAFFIMVTPQVCGIMDVNSWTPELRYGDRIEATVTKVTPKGVNLAFKKLLE